MASKRIPIGKNTIATYPRLVAEFLGLEKAQNHIRSSLSLATQPPAAQLSLSVQNNKDCTIHDIVPNFRFRGGQ
jgi:hypothetical protein